MPFEWIPALVAGFVATLVMSALMQTASRTGMTHMPGIAIVMGAMMSGDESKAKAMGWFVHVVVMGTIVFGTVYGLLFSALGTSAVSTPGMMGKAWGGMTPMGVLVGHVVYGTVLALVYTWLV